MLTQRELARAQHICKKARKIYDATGTQLELSERDVGFVKDTEWRLNRFGVRTGLSPKQWEWLEDICKRAI